MSPFLQFSLIIVIIISAAKASGYVSYRLGQPSVLGELLAGIILGPSLVNLFSLPFLSDLHLHEFINHLSELGVMILMFLAGLDLHLPDLIRSGKVSIFAGIMGVLVPILMGTFAGLMFSLTWTQAVFLSLVLAATSVSISAQTLMELKVLRSKVGVGLLGAAVFDDVLVLFGLSVYSVFVMQTEVMGITQVILVAVRILLFLLISSLTGRWLLPFLASKIGKLPISQGEVAFAFVTLLFFGWSAEHLGGMAVITGAFLAGLWFSRLPEREKLIHGFQPLAYGFLVPIFFIQVGLTANAKLLDWNSFLFLVVLIFIACLSKILGAGGGALLSGFSMQESLQLGVGMMSRGEVGLIVASLGVSQGLVSDHTYAAIVGVVIVTTLLTPFLLKNLYPKTRRTS